MLATDRVHQWVLEVVISGDEEKLHLHFVDETENSCPLSSMIARSSAYPSIRSPIDITNAERQATSVCTGLHPDPWSMATRLVGHDGDTKSVRVIQHRLVGPGPASFKARQHNAPGKLRDSGIWMIVVLPVIRFMSYQNSRAENEHDEN